LKNFAVERWEWEMTMEGEKEERRENDEGNGVMR
jgi:hypothetical protein